MAARVHLHVGLPKTGTTFLQASLARHTELLAERRCDVPHGPAVVQAALDVRGEHDGFGHDPERTRGSFERLARRAHQAARDGHDTVLSHELFGAADADQARAALTRLAPLEVHLVVTVRDPARQALAEWQEGIKHGRRLSFEKFARTVLPLDAESKHARRFHAAQELVAVLDRWGTPLPPPRVHVVTCPPAGTDPQVLWERFGAALDLDLDGLEPVGREHSNPSLGTREIALLRRVNRHLDKRLPQPGYGRAVKRVYAQRVLAGLDSPRPELPVALLDPLRERAERWGKEVETAGWTVHGDLADLVPPAREEHAPHPDEVAPEALLDGAVEGTAGLLLELAATQGRVAELEEEVERLARKRRKLRSRLTRLEKS